MMNRLTTVATTKTKSLQRRNLSCTRSPSGTMEESTEFGYKVEGDFLQRKKSVQTQRLGDSTVCSVWNDLGKVQIWNLTNALNQANQMTGPSQTVKAEKVNFMVFFFNFE